MPDPTPTTYRLADFDYALPPERIAQAPPAERSASRLLDGRGAAPVDRAMRDLPGLLRAGDLLVFNDTRVLKARLHGRKPSGGAVEALVERVLPGHEVLAQLRASKALRPGGTIRFADAFDAEVVGRGGADGSLFRLRFPDEPRATSRCSRARPGRWRRRPRRCTSTTRCSARCARRAWRRRRSRCTSAPAPSSRCGTTTCRCTGCTPSGTASATTRSPRSPTRGGGAPAWWRSAPRCFVTPGFEFRVADLLLTNFHLPKSTLLMLVSAFAGYGHVRALYRHAVEARYRFFSYGDAMVLARATGG